MRLKRRELPSESQKSRPMKRPFKIKNKRLIGSKKPISMEIMMNSPSRSFNSKMNKSKK
jgi:hypothetical protein